MIMFIFIASSNNRVITLQQKINKKMTPASFGIDGSVTPSYPWGGKPHLDISGTVKREYVTATEKVTEMIPPPTPIGPMEGACPFSVQAPIIDTDETPPPEAQTSWKQ